SDKTVTYNGSNHTIVIPTLPSGMSVSSSSVTGKEYDSNHNLSVDVSANQTGSDVITRTNAGVYAITVNFSGGRNYNDTSSSANLTINIADPGNISFLATNAYNGKGWTYDGTTHTITPNAPEGVEITYSYTGTYSGTDNKIKHAGEYTLVANIHGGSNYYDASTSVSFVVTKANLSATLNELVVTYTGSPHTYTLTNKVQGVGEDGQFNPSSCTIVYSYSGKVFVEDDTTEPTGATVSSTGNTATNAGWYSMKLEISTTSDYNTLTISSTNNFRINKANSSFAVSEIWALSGTTFKNPFNFDSITSQIITYTSSDTEKVKIQTSDGVVSFLVTSIINDRTSSTEASEVTITATSKNVATKTFVIHLIPFSYYSSEKDVDYTSSKPNHNGGVLFQATLMPNKIVDGVIMGERETLAVEGIDSWALSSNYEYGPVELEEGIKTIGQYAFEESKITAVLLPSTLTSFGESAFRNSTVTSINIPDGITAITNRCFQGCTSLPTITFPSALKTLGQYAFSGCSLFSAITLPTSVTLIDDGCFYSCTSLQSINIPNGISALSSYCFYNCTSLNNLSIPMSVQTINKYCFYQCTSFSDTVVLPIYLTSIGESAFQKCTGIKNIKFLNEDNSNIHEEDNYYRLSLGSSAFSDCVNLENFDDFICCNPTEKINSNGESTISYDYYVKTKNYGYRSFYNCSSLIGVGVFANGLNLLEYQEDKKEQVMLALSLYGISSNVDALGFRITLLASTGGSNVADAIVMATILSQSFTLHDSKLVIEDKAFYNCQSLLMFDLYSVGADVGAMAFYNCNELYLVKRLNGKVNFQNGAFTNCGNFKNPTRYCCFDETQKITAGSNVFSGSYVFLITLENKVEQVISIFQDCACINDMICRITSSFVVDDEVTYAVRVNDKWAHIFYLKAMVEHSYQSINVTSIGPTIDYAWRAESDYVQEDDWLVKKFWFVEGATVTITYKRTTGMVCYCSFNSDNYFGSVAGSSSNTKSYSFTSNGNYYAKMWT
ncbi:MAG: leucine-rich repeat protein, partial [Christensenellales bacterium]